MIVEMRKVYVVARNDDQHRLLEALGRLSVIHLTPLSPQKAAEEEKVAAEIDQYAKAIQVLERIRPDGEPGDISPAAAAAETLQIHRDATVLQGRLNVLHRQYEELAVWGDVTLEQFEQLAEAGITPAFYTMPADDAEKLNAECVSVIAAAGKGKMLVAVVNRSGELELPESAAAVELPKQDRPAVKAEAAGIEAQLKANDARLPKLAALVPAMQKQLAALREKADFLAANRGGLTDDRLFAIQGWVPAEKSETLTSELAAEGVDAAVETVAPAENEDPPTLIRYPRWTKPIGGLFKILGTVAGYRELDISVPFMLALPLFAAMLIGDGGYGAIMFLLPLLLYKKAARQFGEQFTRLIIIFGGATMIWGFITATFFGVTIYKPFITVDMSDASRALLMRISFTIGAIHLTWAQLRRGLVFWPSLKSLGPVGWATFIWGMYGVVKYFVLGDPLNMDTPWPYLLLAGAALAILFHSPSKNPLKMIGLGLANFPLSMISSFSDVISYVRLMAVGLAGGVLASSFNDLAMSTGNIFTIIPILVLGHALNIGLTLIAIFAHGVRLNMLEFSNNLGIQWSGYAYQPFAQTNIKETER